jgi:hypothetical protein
MNILSDSQVTPLRAKRCAAQMLRVSFDMSGLISAISLAMALSWLLFPDVSSSPWMSMTDGFRKGMA